MNYCGKDTAVNPSWGTLKIWFLHVRCKPDVCPGIVEGLRILKVYAGKHVVCNNIYIYNNNIIIYIILCNIIYILEGSSRESCLWVSSPQLFAWDK